MKRYADIFERALILGSCLVSSTLFAQRDETILSAMQDELKRSMEIRETGYDKPFFISYGLTDVKSYSVYATLGAIVQSEESNNRGKSLRVLVGDYSFNDESLDNDTQSESSGVEIQLPSDDDYAGIRRAYWTTTDAIYRGAAQKYRKHQQTLKEQQKKIEGLPHRTFAKVPVIKKIAPWEEYNIPKSDLVAYCRKLSAVFKEFPGMESSDVMVNVLIGRDYFINSEGTVVVRPYRLAMLQCRAEFKTAHGEPITESIVHYAELPGDFPKLETMITTAKEMASKLQSVAKSPSLEEEYSGPVLFMGSAVASALSSTLFSYRETLVASNDIASSTDQRPENNALFDSRIGKSIIDNSLTVTAKPKLRKFGNVSLLGAYDVDEEGVVPADELILVEKGILKNQLNDRSLTRDGQVANGHAGGAAVVEVSTAKGTPEAALKQTLIALAKAEGLPYAIVVRESGDVRGNMAEVWRVDLESGAETLLRPAQVRRLSFKDLRKIYGASSVQQAYNVPAGEGSLTSIICPSAMLLERIDVVPLRLPYVEDDVVYVPSPLAKGTR
ncbi:MAG TPA: metallopeptidase TldD-related protein [Chryseolinea sp.]|nr:metallopeptidase TldD-related protein [Chryseolinea sp.]